ncbi:MAG: hypothetical protein HYR85_13310 [Planctomycetes bacterium]|nr:hypothetical protein [Planctomycetota bacterium]MBI3844948.1 hypothetical protein [Planctomycetota bacterium]
MKQVVLGLCVAVTASTSAFAQGACGEWTAGLFPVPGLYSNAAHALAVFDDGTGRALYVGGEFGSAGTVVAANRIARWNGSLWSSLGSGLDGTVRALAVFDDGTGVALIAGGEFAMAGGAAASRIAKWNGASWSPLGAGTNDVVRALRVFDDGAGPALFAAGSFTIAGGIACNHIARWNGTSWSALSSGTDDVVRALEPFDDGTGPALYAGGGFTTAGGASANRIAQWNGSMWSPVGSAITAPVHCLRAATIGSSPALYAGTSFVDGRTGYSSVVAKWNGTSWSPLSTGITSGDASAIEVFDHGAGRALVIGGNFSFYDIRRHLSFSNLAIWDGTDLGGTSVMSGLLYSLDALAVFEEGNRRALFLAGAFETSSDAFGYFVTRWDGRDLSPLGGLSDVVDALAVFNDGAGPRLYAGGLFGFAGGTRVNQIARWDGTSWVPLGAGITNGLFVSALRSFDDGSGLALYVGGSFGEVDGIRADGIARWNGSGWSSVGVGLGGYVYALTGFDDGTGPALFATGYFPNAGALTVNHIAKWNGSQWSALGTGLEPPHYHTGRALAVFDDGTGAALYVGGGFATAGGLRSNRIARWDGQSWSALGVGVNGVVNSLAVFDDGTGPALYVGGHITSAGGMLVNQIARWNGHAWSSVGGGVGTSSLDTVDAMAVFDDGTGPALYVAGEFQSAGGTPAVNIARWDGHTWSPLGGGLCDLAGICTYAPVVTSLRVFDDGTGPALFAGGGFTRAGSVASAFVARWKPVPREGNVNAAAGPTANVLLVNGSAGDARREVIVAVGQPLVARLDAAPAGPLSAGYALWSWRGTPTRSTMTTVGAANIGCTVDPTPLSPAASPQPFQCRLGGLGSEYCGGMRLLRSPPSAPWQIVRSSGLAHPIVITLQGVIEDAASANAIPLSTTNALVLRVQ